MGETILALWAKIWARAQFETHITKKPPELVAAVLLLLSDCPLLDSVFHRDSVSPSRDAGSLLSFPEDVFLRFLQRPSAQSGHFA